jgi:pyrimidine-nucleoside phosphorylase
LEVAEALEALEGNGPPELTDFTVDLASLIVELATEGASGRAEVLEALRSGRGLDSFRAMVDAQGGDSRAFDERSRLPRAALQEPLVADADGYIARLDALSVAHAATLLGAGRERKGEPIDLSVGVVVQVKIGDRVARGQPLAVLHANDAPRLAQAQAAVRAAVTIGEQRVEPPPLVIERLLTPSAGNQA